MGHIVTEPDAMYDVVVLDDDVVLHDLNDRCECVGQRVVDGSALRAILVTATETTDLPTLGGSAGAARGINNGGAIVGGALTTGDTAYHAFLFEAGLIHDLNVLIPPSVDCELIQALGINDRGDIIAIGHHAGVDRVVLLKRRA